MKTKLEVAHEWYLKCLEVHESASVHGAWQYADAMQAEADKRTTEVIVSYASKEFHNKLEVLCKKEWQPDWSQAPEWANWWVIGSLTKQGIWSEAKPNSVRINGADYWEVTSPIGDEHLSVAPSFNYQGDWRNSLRKRPE